MGLNAYKAFRQSGFTLIEVMLVIVIISIFAGMVSLAVGGTHERQVKLAQEQLANQLSMVNLEATDQGKVLGLVVHDATATQPATYQWVEYQKNQPDRDKRWLPSASLKMQTLPGEVQLRISPLQTQLTPTAADFTQGDLPQILWWGNGEVTPVRLQLWYQNRPLGNALYLNELGRVSTQEGQGTQGQIVNESS